MRKAVADKETRAARARKRETLLEERLRELAESAGITIEAPMPAELPVLPIREGVYFPEELAPLLVGRERSLKALDHSMKTDRLLLVVSQRDVTVEDPQQKDLYGVGVVAEAVQVLPVPDGTIRVVLRGIQRARIDKIVSTHPHLVASITPIELLERTSARIEALMRECVRLFEQVAQMGKQVPSEALQSISYIDKPGRLADSIAHHLSIRLPSKQQILETEDSQQRLQTLVKILNHELEVLEVQNEIRSRVEREMGDTQREYYLREQMRIIQQELSERDDRGSEIEEYRDKVADAQMPEEVAERADHEIKRLEKMPPAAPEGVVIRTYLDWLCCLPWNIKTEDSVDIKAAQKVLDADHFGLHKVKERILEFLAVRQLTSAQKGPILCFVGPPGVGKTSIGRSIARSLGRKFIRVSLGGVRDEAEIRGHRRTYVGSMPGRVIHGIKQCGTRNPVFMLDEIDKLGMDFRGDPTAALLEALDPEQNDRFSDHYLEVPFDLSDVMFIMTANILDTIPHALLDRMEVIRFPGYIEQEKMQIANGFLVPKSLRDHGLSAARIKFEQEALLQLMRCYTREAGVRSLEREISGVCRKVARRVAEGYKKQVVVTDKNLSTMAGKPKFRYGLKESKNQLGAVTGLVYTEFGGDIVTVEVAVAPGKGGELLLTGQLGDVMKESAQAALTFIKSRAKQLDWDPEALSEMDLHIHVPAGAVPKDGPSAGITIATALASAVSGRKVRPDIVMTGEITLRGKVLPVGGIKEKMLAAHRAGIFEVILPADNRPDLDDIPEATRKQMSFHFVRHIDEALKLALV